MSGSTRWWREREVLWLIALVVGVYWVRLCDLPIRGEESRWAGIAREMMQTGDWVVPRQQGEPFLSRPPLGSWLIALAARARGKCDVLAVRLPTALATLGLTLLIYGYARLFLSRTGALAAAAAYATMGQVLELGRVAESDGLYALLVGGSLLVWHWGFTRGRLGSAWIAGYALAALAALAKSPQGPAYFVASVGAFLIFTGRYRLLFTRGHLLGITTFVLVLGAWYLPFYRDLGWDGVRQVLFSDATARFYEQGIGVRLIHMVRYPVGLLICTLPWSPLLLLFAAPELRRSLGAARPAVQFLAVCLAVTFPTCWLVPDARGRYFMSLYPCLAVLIGLVIQRCEEAAAGSALHRGWRRYLFGMAGMMAGLGLLVLWSTAGGPSGLELLSQPPVFAAAYALAAAALALAVARWFARRDAAWTVEPAVLAVAAFSGLTMAGVALNTMARYSEDTSGQVARLKEQLPENVRLVSFGSVHHQFAYHYGVMIPQRAWPDSRDCPEVEYFCFHAVDAPPLPFAWEEVAVISCDRYRLRTNRQLMIVGRRCGEKDTYPLLASAWPVPGPSVLVALGWTNEMARPTRFGRSR